MTGSDIKRYRRLINWNQGAFAKELRLSQSALSLLEGGKTAVSEDHVTRMAKAFDDPKLKPRFSDYLKQIERERSEGQAALSAPMICHSVLTVWEWSDDFDLSRLMAPDRAVGLVAIRATNHKAIAFQMGKAADVWMAGEILVFEHCERKDLRDGDICLVQAKSPRARGNRTMIAIAHLAPATRGQTLQLEPVSPAGTIFLAGDELIACLRAVYRGRYCD